MSLDPQAQAMLAAYSGMPAIDFAQLTASAYRAMLAAGGGSGGGFAAGDQIAGEEDWIIPASGARCPPASTGRPATALSRLQCSFTAAASSRADSIRMRTCADAWRSVRKRWCCRSITGSHRKRVFLPLPTMRATRLAGRTRTHAIYARGLVQLQWQATARAETLPPSRPSNCVIATCPLRISCCSIRSSIARSSIIRMSRLATAIS